MTCILCQSPTVEPLLTDYFWCKCCDLRFLAPIKRLSYEAETARYQSHNNNPDDPNYQNFVRPLFNEIKQRAEPGKTGLDFGAGKGSALAKLLVDAGYDITVYDPAFFQNPEALEKKYNFVCASEVVEHLFDPASIFSKFKALIKENGFLAVMTHLYDETINFQTWYYRKDPTHVCFYTKKTFEWIAKECDFSAPVFVGERIVLL